MTQANKTDTALKTEKGMLKFYLLTNRGKYTIKDKMENVNNHTSVLNYMFTEANKLIAYIRMTEDNMKQQRKMH